MSFLTSSYLIIELSAIVTNPFQINLMDLDVMQDQIVELAASFDSRLVSD